MKISHFNVVQGLCPNPVNESTKADESSDPSSDPMKAPMKAPIQSKMKAKILKALTSTKSKQKELIINI